MKHTISTILLLLSFSPASQASGWYLDIGVGWLQELPTKASIEIHNNGFLIFEESQEASVNIESPFIDIGAGYEFKNNMYIELSRFGVLDDTSNSMTVFKVGIRIQ